MISPKQTYRHIRSGHTMKILNQSPMHPDHWHIGLELNGTAVIHCHIHHKDITEDWKLTSQGKEAVEATTPQINKKQ